MDTGYYIGVLVVAIICGLISKAIAESRGMEGGFWWGFFLTIIGIVVVAVRPKENTAENVTNSTITNSISEHEVINSIKEYKELLDTGVITEEEFAKKKEQLLNQATSFEASTRPDSNTDNGTIPKKNPELDQNIDAPPVRPMKTEERGTIKCPLCGEIQYSGHTACERCGVQFIKNK